MAPLGHGGLAVSIGAGLEVAGLTIGFGDATAVSGVSFTVAAGSTLAVLGPSGSGKSTLLRGIGGLEPLRAGTVSIDGVDQAGVPSHRRQLGMMFQDHALFPHMDVASNVAFGLEMRGVTGARSTERVAEMLELVGLGGFGLRDVTTLSGGEAQRVALARALAPSPRILMLDEPLGSLDRILREDLVDELRGLFARLDVTVLHVTHDQQEAFALADDVLIMREGAVAQHGPPADVWHRPVDEFVAHFLGHPNIWAAPSGRVLAPLSSVAIRSPSSTEPERRAEAIPAVVEGVAFREGRWRLRLVESSGDRRRIVVDTDVEHRVGNNVVVQVDLDGLHPLGDASALD